MKVVWSSTAERRAHEAFDWIARDRPAAAERWLGGLLELVGGLDRFPKRGRRVPEIGKAAYRQLLHHPFRIIYRVDDHQVVMLTIRHVRRAWDPEEIGRAG